MPFNRNLLPDPIAYFEAQGLKLINPSRARWQTTQCKFHGGSQSMRVNRLTGAYSCMAGCGASGGDVLAYEIAATGEDFVTAAKALGAWVDDGRPHTPQKPTPLDPRAALSALALEATLIVVAAGNISKGVMLTDADKARVMQAAGRIIRMMELFT